MITVDKNVPMPRARRRASKYPWREMDIGDSFFIAGEIREALGARGFAPIALSPRDGTRVRLMGTSGPYGVTYWEAVGRWIRAPLNPMWSGDFDWYTDSNASLRLAGYEPTHWAALAPTS